MRTVIHLSNEEADSFFKLVDQADKIARSKGEKTSDVLKDYLKGPKGEEDICIRFSN